jgi:hypothetical protein
LDVAALAAGDVATAADATQAWPYLSALPQTAAVRRTFSAQAALARGDLLAARRGADEAVTSTTGYYLPLALLTRAHVAIAQGEPEQGERDAHDALACTAEVEAYLLIPDILECLARLAGDAGSHREAARANMAGTELMAARASAAAAGGIHCRVIAHRVRANALQNQRSS